MITKLEIEYQEYDKIYQYVEDNFDKLQKTTELHTIIDRGQLTIHDKNDRDVENLLFRFKDNGEVFALRATNRGKPLFVVQVKVHEGIEGVEYTHISEDFQKRFKDYGTMHKRSIDIHSYIRASVIRVMYLLIYIGTYEPKHKTREQIRAYQRKPKRKGVRVRYEQEHVEYLKKYTYEPRETPLDGDKRPHEWHVDRFIRRGHFRYYRNKDGSVRKKVWIEKKEIVINEDGKRGPGVKEVRFIE